MKLIVLKNKLLGGVLYLAVMVVVLFLSSCSHEQNYETIRKIELEKGVRIDSVLLGIHLGMNHESFFYYCFDQNKQGVFKQNQTGTMVNYEFTQGFSLPVKFEFFPFEKNSDDAIISFVGSLRYQNFSYYDKKYAIEKLVAETLKFYEEGYGGRKFIELPHENKLLKYKYVKIDGNRQITVKPSFSGQYLDLRFEDLNFIAEGNGK